MTAQVKAIPVFYENRETQGIVSGDVIDMPMPMPNDSKVLVKVPASSFSQSNANFQVPNVSTFVDSNYKFKFEFTMVHKGQTLQSNSAGDITATNGLDFIGTPAYFWSPDNGGVVPLFINKLINSATFNVANKQWVEVNGRSEPELVDIYGMQLDQRKLAEHGIYLTDNIGVLEYRKCLGVGNQSRRNQDWTAPAPFNYWEQGLQLSLNNEFNALKPTVKAVKQKYVTVKSVVFTTTENLGSGVSLSPVLDGKLGPNVWVPVRSDTGAPYYSGINNTLTQTTVIEVREYLISPNTSNPYSINDYCKTYPTLGYPLNLALTFNNNIMEWGPITTASSIGQLGGGISSFTLTGAELSLFTFDAKKKLQSDILRTLYMYVDRQSVPNIVQTIDSKYLKRFQNDQVKTLSQKVSSSNLTSLPPYIFLYISTRMWENQNLLKNLSFGEGEAKAKTVSPYILHPMTRVRVSYGPQSDVIWGSENTMEELQDMTMKFISEPRNRQIIACQSHPLLAESILDGAVFQDVLPANYYTTVASDPDRFWTKQSNHATGLPFLILETASLNFRSLPNAGNLPVIPEFNMGSSNYRSLTVELDWEVNQSFCENVTTNGVYSADNVIFQPNVVFVTNRVRSINLSATGTLADDNVEYDFLANRTELTNIITDFVVRNNSKNTAQDQLQFVGGSFFGNILSSVRSVLPHVASAVRGIHSASSTASNILNHLGQGRRRTTRR